MIRDKLLIRLFNVVGCLLVWLLLGLGVEILLLWGNLMMMIVIWLIVRADGIPGILYSLFSLRILGIIPSSWPKRFLRNCPGRSKNTINLWEWRQCLWEILKITIKLDKQPKTSCDHKTTNLCKQTWTVPYIDRQHGNSNISRRIHSNIHSHQITT